MLHSNCQCPSPLPSFADHWKGCLLWKSLRSGKKDGIDDWELSTVKCLHFIPWILNSPTNSCCIHLAKPACFKSTEMKREKQVLLCIFGRGQPHFISLNVADVALLGWPVCGLYLWILLWEREYRVQDRHGKGIRQMCCCVWVDQAPGFYCCFSREPLGSLNLPVKFWESQRKSATFLCRLAVSTLLQAFH